LASLLDLITGKADQPGAGQRFWDTFVHAAIHSPLGGGGLARAYFKTKGYTDAQINQAIKNSDADFDKKYSKAPVFQGVRNGHPLDYVSPANIGRAATTLLGHVLGGVDPTYAIAPGANAAERIPAQMAVQGASSAARQKVEVNTGQRDRIDPKQVLIDEALGGLFQGGLEGGKAAIGKFAKDAVLPDEAISDIPLAPDGLPGNGSVRPMDPKVIAKIMNDPEAVGLPAPEAVDAPAMPEVAPEAPVRKPATSPSGLFIENKRDPDGTIYLSYQPSLSKAPVPIKMGIGEDGTAEMAIDQFSTQANRLGPSKIREAMYDLMDMYPEIKRFGGYRRSGAGAGRVQEIEPTRPVEDPIGTPPEAEAPVTPESQVTPVEEIPQGQGMPANDVAPDTFMDYLGRKFASDPNYVPTEDEFARIRQVATDSHEPFDPSKPLSDDVLTPAERQDMDASADKPIVDNTGYEAHTPFVGEPNEPANDTSLLDAARKFLPNLLSDERGSINLGDDADGISPVEKLTQAIADALPIRNKQGKLYSEELSKRVGNIAQVRNHTSGLEGFYAELGQLKGEMPKIDFQSIGDNFSPEEVNGFMDMIKNHPRLTFFESINARKGLLKLLQGELPTKSELAPLSAVFPKEAIDAINAKAPLSAMDIAANLLGIPRALKATLDLSAPFRQGAPLIHTKAYWKSFGAMFGQAFSEAKYQAIQNEIYSRPTYQLMKDAGLAITRQGKALTEREEQFMSNWAEKIPVAGRVVRASDRGYTGFLNKLRADTFDSLVREAREAGIDFAHDPKALHDIATFINNATGRGHLPGKILNQAQPLLSASFFSPRLMASRFNILNPNYYVQLSPFARKQAIKSLLAYSSAVMMTLGLAKLAGADVETDPRSTDFAKIKDGNTRYDVTAGFQPYLRAGAQLLTGQKVTASGKVTNIGTGPDGKALMQGKLKMHGADKGYKQDTRLDVVGRFFANKEAPIPAFVSELLREHDMGGKPLTISGETANLFAPMIAQDVYDAVQDRGAEGLMIIPPDLFGIGINTYPPNTPKGRQTKDKNFSSGFGKSGFKSDFKSAF
jgi:hypothetical protein